eukprot:SAG11_NODE_9527_length_903_cov_1.003731_2_plen_164_part_01
MAAGAGEESDLRHAGAVGAVPFRSGAVMSRDRAPFLGGGRARGRERERDRQRQRHRERQKEREREREREREAERERERERERETETERDRDRERHTETELRARAPPSRWAGRRRVGRLCSAAGRPAGHSVGTQIVNSPGVRKISFTGSEATGKKIMAVRPPRPE